MSNLRQAAQQALEHVQEFKRRWWQVPAFGNKVNKATREAITNAHSQIFELEHSLHAALAEQPAEPQDPVAYNGWVLREVLFDNGEPVGHREPPKAESQEPVAWEWRWFDASPYTVTSGQWSEWKRVEPRNPLCTVEDSLNEFRSYIAQGKRYELRALYTTPQPRKRLTDEEIQRVYREFMLYQDGLTPSGMQRVARAIEAAVWGDGK